MFKRSLLYLRRKYKRSILLFLLLFVISFSLSVGGGGVGQHRRGHQRGTGQARDEFYLQDTARCGGSRLLSDCYGAGWHDEAVWSTMN